MAMFTLGLEAGERRPLSREETGGKVGRIQETAQTEAARGWEFRLAWDLPRRGESGSFAGGYCVGAELQEAQPQVEALRLQGQGRGAHLVPRVPSPSTAPGPEPTHLSEAGQVRAALPPPVALPLLPVA